MRALPRLVARIPAAVHTKLLVAFLIIVALLIALGAVGLEVLGEVNRRSEDLVKLQRKIAAYRQLQHDTTGQLYSVAAALLVPEDRSLDSILRQLNQFGYDLDRLQFVARDEVELLGRVRVDYDEFIRVVTRVVELIRSGRAAEGRELQLAQATPLADRLERLTNQLVNQAEADMVASVDTSHDAFVRARWAVIGFAVGATGLALVLGFAISWSLVGAVAAMDTGLVQIASGDFSRHVDIPNRDELGALAANLNRMNDELGRLYRELEAKQAEYVRVILTSGRHLLSLINDILDLSKVEAGRMELDLGTFNLRMALENALTLIRERAMRHGLALDLTVDETLEDIVADERKLKQVLLNLLSNAVKFTPEGGRIDVRALSENGTVQVSVSDTGVGIAPEDQEAIFEEFRQVGHADRKREGTGLGLALARKFVELHGGRLWVKSEVGGGSTFTFTLPASPHAR